jgi:hypothetical protein
MRFYEVFRTPGEEFALYLRSANWYRISTEELYQMIKSSGEIFESDSKKKLNENQVEQIYISNFFEETLQGLDESVKNKLIEFCEVKKQDFMTPFGAKDSPMDSGGPIGRENPGIRHARLSQDHRIFYMIENIGGKRTLKLYGVYTHGESGTGSTPQRNRQKIVGKRFKDSEFNRKT